MSACLCVINFCEQDISKTNYLIFAKCTADISWKLLLSVQITDVSIYVCSSVDFCRCKPPDNRIEYLQNAPVHTVYVYVRVSLICFPVIVYPHCEDIWPTLAYEVKQRQPKKDYRLVVQYYPAHKSYRRWSRVLFSAARARVCVKSYSSQSDVTWSEYAVTALGVG